MQRLLRCFSKIESGDQPEQKYQQDEGQDDLQCKVEIRAGEQNTKGTQGEYPEGDFETRSLTYFILDGH